MKKTITQCHFYILRCSVSLFLLALNKRWGSCMWVTEASTYPFLLGWHSETAITGLLVTARSLVSDDYY